MLELLNYYLVKHAIADETFSVIRVIESLYLPLFRNIEGISPPYIQRKFKTVLEVYKGITFSFLLFFLHNPSFRFQIFVNTLDMVITWSHIADVQPSKFGEGVLEKLKGFVPNFKWYYNFYIIFIIVIAF